MSHQRIFSDHLPQELQYNTIHRPVTKLKKQDLKKESEENVTRLVNQHGQGVQEQGVYDG